MTLIHSARIVSDGHIIDDAWVRFSGGVITGRGVGAPDRSASGPEERDRIDARGRLLTPGFIDIHNHGGGGALYNEGAQGIAQALRVHRSHGTTRSLLSLSAAAMSGLERQLHSIAEYARTDPLILGAHLEGPFLSQAHRGSHDPALLRLPEPEAVDRLLEAGEGFISQVTLAPELPGGMEALGRFLDAGVAVAIGHTDSDYSTARAAFDNGASLLTHAFNGMPGIHHRAPGPVMAAIRSPWVVLELVNDEVHVDLEVIQLAFSAARGRIAFITDAMAAAGHGDGEYRSGTMDVIVRDGVARLADGGAISGSTLTLDMALRNAVRSGVPVPDAVEAVTTVPARALGVDDKLGRLDVGFSADVVLIESDFSVLSVWADGLLLD